MDEEKRLEEMESRLARLKRESSGRGSLEITYLTAEIRSLKMKIAEDKRKREEQRKREKEEEDHTLS